MSSKKYYIAGSLTGILFLILLIIVKSDHLNSPISWLDTPIQNMIYPLQSNHFLVTLSGMIAKFLGDTIGAITGFVIFVILLICRQKIGAIYLALTASFAVLLNTGIKAIIGRNRPDLHRLPAYIHEPGKSFASGHSTFATILFGVLAIIIIRQIKNRYAQILTGMIALALIFLTMFSRILIGVHYPSDTIAGFLLGLTVILFTYPTFVKFDSKK